MALVIPQKIYTIQYIIYNYAILTQLLATNYNLRTQGSSATGATGIENRALAVATQIFPILCISQSAATGTITKRKHLGTTAIQHLSGRQPNVAEVHKSHQHSVDSITRL